MLCADVTIYDELCITVKQNCLDEFILFINVFKYASRYSVRLDVHRSVLGMRISCIAFMVCDNSSPRLTAFRGCACRRHHQAGKWAVSYCCCWNQVDSLFVHQEEKVDFECRISAKSARYGPTRKGSENHQDGSHPWICFCCFKHPFSICLASRQRFFFLERQSRLLASIIWKDYNFSSWCWAAQRGKFCHPSCAPSALVRLLS